MTLKKKHFISILLIYLISAYCRTVTQEGRPVAHGIAYVENIYSKAKKDRYIDCATCQTVSMDTLFRDLVIKIGPTGMYIARDVMLSDSLKVYLRYFDLLALEQNFNRTVFQIDKDSGLFEITMIRYLPGANYPVVIHKRGRKTHHKEPSNPVLREEIEVTNPMYYRHQKSWYMFLTSGEEVRLDTVFNDLNIELIPKHPLVVDSVLLSTLKGFSKRLNWLGPKYGFNRIRVKVVDTGGERILTMLRYIPGAGYPLHYNGNVISFQYLQRAGTFK